MKAKQVFVSMRNSHGKKAKHSMHECGEGFIAHTPLIVLFEPRITAAGMAKEILDLDGVCGVIVYNFVAMTKFFFFTTVCV
jgi:hypothetical protein